MQDFGLLHWCWLGGRFRIVLSQVLHHLLYHMGLCQVGAAIFSSVLTPNNYSMVPSTITSKFISSYIQLQCTNTIDLVLQWLSHMYREFTWLTPCRRNIHWYLTCWILDPLWASWLDTYTIPLHIVFDHRCFCVAWVHSHLCLHLPLGKLMANLGRCTYQWVTL